MDKKITQKIKELLTPEDLKLFESALDNYTKAEVQKAIELMKEEVKLEYDELSKKFCDKKIEEAQKKFDEDFKSAKATLVEEYDGKLNQLEMKVVGRLDTFIESVVSEKISDEKIQMIAESQIMTPIVEKIKKVFGESYITLDTEGSTQIAESQKTIQKLEKQLSEAIASKIESDEKLDKTASYLFISESTKGLNETDTSRVVKMFKDKKFSEVKEKIGSFIELIKEHVEVPVKDEKAVIDSIISEDDGIKEEKTVIEESDESSSMLKDAERFLD